MSLVLLLALAFFSCSSSDDNSSQGGIKYEQYGSPFTKVPASNDAVIYQVNIRAFSNEGTLKGVEKRLDSIQKLGINVLYLMPIYPVGQVKASGKLGSPYAVKNYKEVNPDFGTLADLRSLVVEAHKRDMAVMLDWVANHTAWDNPWIKDHPNWYKQDANGNIIIPPGTNYNDVAQLNFDNSEMKTAMIDAMSYWVYAANIDGYRCDYADFVPQTFWTEALSTIRKIKKQNFLFLAEGSRMNHYAAGFDYTFGFAFFDRLKEVFKDGKAATLFQDQSAIDYPVNGSKGKVIRYTTNHDVNLSHGTPQEVTGGDQASMAAFIIAAYMKSVPMIYNGQEVGYAKRLDYFDRTPIDWTTSNYTLLKEYKKIVAFRKSSDALKNGNLIGYSSTDLSVFTMETTTQKVLVIANTRDKEVKYIAPSVLKNMAWKDAFTGGSVTIGNETIIKPYQYLVLKN